MKCPKCNRPRHYSQASNIDGLCKFHLDEYTKEMNARVAPQQKIKNPLKGFLGTR